MGDVQRLTASLTSGGGREPWRRLRRVARGRSRRTCGSRPRLAQFEVRLQEQRALALGASGWSRCWTCGRQVTQKTLVAGHRGRRRDVVVPHGDHRSRRRGDGVAADMAVICRRAAWWGASSAARQPRAARVQLLVDRNAAAGALIERSRAGGVVVGDDGVVASDGLRVEPGRRAGRGRRRDVRPGRRVPARVRDRARWCSSSEASGCTSRFKVKPAVDFSCARGSARRGGAACRRPRCRRDGAGARKAPAVARRERACRTAGDR